MEGQTKKIEVLVLLVASLPDRWSVFGSRLLLQHLLLSRKGYSRDFERFTNRKQARGRKWVSTLLRPNRERIRSNLEDLRWCLILLTYWKRVKFDLLIEKFTNDILRYWKSWLSFVMCFHSSLSKFSFLTVHWFLSFFLRNNLFVRFTVDLKEDRRISQHVEHNSFGSQQLQWNLGG